MKIFLAHRLTMFVCAYHYFKKIMWINRLKQLTYLIIRSKLVYLYCTRQRFQLELIAVGFFQTQRNKSDIFRVILFFLFESYTNNLIISTVVQTISEKTFDSMK